MIAIVDYGVGNLFSLKSSLEAVGADVVGVIGRKFILYRESEKNKRIELK
jgi:RNA-binding protein YhbY